MVNRYVFETRAQGSAAHLHLRGQMVRERRRLRQAQRGAPAPRRAPRTSDCT